MISVGKSFKACMSSSTTSKSSNGDSWLTGPFLLRSFSGFGLKRPVRATGVCIGVDFNESCTFCFSWVLTSNDETTCICEL